MSANTLPGEVDNVGRRLSSDILSLNKRKGCSWWRHQMELFSCYWETAWVFSFTFKVSTVSAGFMLWGRLFHKTGIISTDRAAMWGAACQLNTDFGHSHLVLFNVITSPLSCALLSIFRDKFPYFKRLVLVPKSYTEIDLNFLKEITNGCSSETRHSCKTWI